MGLVKNGTDPRGCVWGAGQVGMMSPGSRSSWEFLETLSKGPWQGMRAAAFLILPNPHSLPPRLLPFLKPQGVTSPFLLY